MPRCSFLAPYPIAALCVLLCGQPALAQTAPASGLQARTFPAQALRGRVAFGPSQGTAQVNGQAVRTAPGLRIFDTQNHLVMPYKLKGQTLTVNYLIEPGTGMLRTVWLLNKLEASKPGKGPQERNFEFASEQSAQLPTR